MRRAEQQRLAVEEAARAAEERRAAAESAEHEAQEAKIRDTEGVADRFAQEGRLDDALAQYRELLRLIVTNQDETQRVREKVVKFVAESATQPEVPEEARRRAVRARAILTNQPGRFADAAEELNQAVLAAPWWGDAYYNLGVVQAGAEDYAGALRSFRLSLLANPNGPNAGALQNKIYELEVQKEQADKVAALNGHWKNSRSGTGYTVKINGNKIEARSDGGLVLRGTKNGDSVEGTAYWPQESPWQGVSCVTPAYEKPMTGSIATDYRSISFHTTQNNYTSNSWRVTGLINTTGHYNGECIQVTLQGTGPFDLELIR